ncbi:substrate-binding domain-containing protein [Labrys monachus]|uniref:Ribose transport system substrate-binding protein n=1 Tax=Labrys monachus TaxID=217067 RepID=A0ABU0FFD4_9HYPH|nr:substrate-binding domain-containing protein [Labrys monachus]MDQ0393322.1 ribose transport system substrate-binding protein [Labrys monachus]
MQDKGRDGPAPSPFAGESPSAQQAPAVAGLGPHGERPATPDQIDLSPEALARARTGGLRVSIVLHTITSDWSRRQIAGIEAELRRVGAVVDDVVGCSYDASTQVAAIERVIRRRPDAVISIPVAGAAVAQAFRKVSSAGIRLILLDNAPSGLLPEMDYVTVVSCDNFGLGQIAAGLLSPHVPQGGAVCVLAYKLDFFATAQREIAFNRWMRRERPDVALSQLKFERPSEAGAVIAPHLDRHPGLDGLFVVWDEPAVESLAVLEGRPRRPVMTTVDLGAGVAAALAAGRIVKGVAAQRPYEQGRAAATAAVASLCGHAVPPWIVLPGLGVTAGNVAQAYEMVGGAPTSPERLAVGRE